METVKTGPRPGQALQQPLGRYKAQKKRPGESLLKLSDFTVFFSHSRKKPNLK